MRRPLRWPLSLMGELDELTRQTAIFDLAYGYDECAKNDPMNPIKAPDAGKPLNPPQTPLRSIPTRDCLKSVYEQSAGFCQQVLTQSQEIQPQVIFLASAPGASSPNEMSAMDGETAGRFFENEKTKAMLMTFLQAVFDPSSPEHAAVKSAMGFAPNLVAVVSEAWMAEADPSVIPESIEKNKIGSKAFRAAINAMGGVPVSELPNRKEVVIIQLHSDAGTLVGICPMRRDQKGKPSLTITPFEDFEQQKMAGAMSLNPDPDDEVSQALSRSMRPGRT